MGWCRWFAAGLALLLLWSREYGVSCAERLLIVGGQLAAEGQFPYQVSLQLGGKHFCGGAVYNERTIVTAGHCVHSKRAADLTVVVGTVDTSKGSRSRSVVRVVVHPGYTEVPMFGIDSPVSVNDVALLLLDEPLETDRLVQPLPLQDTTVAPGTVCVVSGWGSVQQGGPTTQLLRYVQVPVVDEQRCRATYHKLRKGMICAGVDEGGRDACQGDSGGPLVCDGYLAGIVSWGEGCALPGTPGVYTDIAVYRGWMLKNGAARPAPRLAPLGALLGVVGALFLSLRQ